MIQEQEEQTDKQKKIRQKQTLKSLTIGQSVADQFNSILIKQFTDMQGCPQYKIKRLFNRLQKFFLRDKQAKINIKNGYFCKRRQPFYSLKNVHVIDNQIILFGVDFAKHTDIIRSYQPQDFCPIDMSHVKLIYNDYFAAMQALRKNQRVGVQENVVKLQPSANQPSKCWMQMKPYCISNYQRRVLARFATTEEHNIKNSLSLDSNIHLFAKKVYEIKKKQAGEINENFIRRQKFISRYPIQRHHQITQNGYGYSRKSSLKKNTLNVDRVWELKQCDKLYDFVRERSRQKYDSNADISFKNSQINQQKAKISNKHVKEEQQVESDASFILGINEQMQEVFKDMKQRLLMMDVEDDKKSPQIYRLSDNMPDKNQCFIEKKPWCYTQYRDEEEKQDERKKFEERSIIELDID